MRKVLIIAGLVVCFVVLLCCGVAWFRREKRNHPKLHLTLNEDVGNALDEDVVIERLSGDPSKPDESVFRASRFLTSSECQHLVNIAQNRLKRSTVQGDDSANGGVTETRAISEARTSSTANLKRHEDDIVRAIEKRACALVGLPIENMETLQVRMCAFYQKQALTLLQVVRYEAGEFYKPHFDYLDRTKESSKASLQGADNAPSQSSCT